MSSVSGYTYVETSVFGGVFDEEFRDPREMVTYEDENI